MNKTDFVKMWYACIDDIDEFLTVGESANILGFYIVDGVKQVWFFDSWGVYDERLTIKETDGEQENEIVKTLVNCGVEFEEV
jgi:hypothetical protein